MYYNANDYELIYLIKDGNLQAQKAFYEKYDHLIFKIFTDKYKYQGLVYEDFRQEAFMILHQAIYLYDSSFQSSFCNFYMILVQRRISKLYRKDGIRLKERYTTYATFHNFENQITQNRIINYVTKDLKDLSSIEQAILNECILNKESMTNFSKKYGISYYDVYKKTKKLKEKIENLLTNTLN